MLCQSFKWEEPLFKKKKIFTFAWTQWKLCNDLVLKEDKNQQPQMTRFALLKLSSNIHSIIYEMPQNGSFICWIAYIVVIVTFLFVFFFVFQAEVVLLLYIGSKTGLNE